MKKSVISFLTLVLGIIGLFSCELIENEPVGNPNLGITGFFPERGALRGDTITIMGTGFDPVTYQNQVTFDGGVRIVQGIPDDNGLIVEDSLFEVDAPRQYAKVVSASFQELQVIVPDEAFGGFVNVLFGVDTASSPVEFELISLLKRPVIENVTPRLGAPGSFVSVSTRNFITTPGGEIDVDSMVVLFGGINAAISPNSILINAQVPSIPAGPTDLRVGVISERGDTLLSQPVNFSILPGILDVPTVYWTGFPQLATYSMRKGSLDDGLISIDSNFVASNFDFTTGIAIDKERELIYWADQNSFVANSTFIYTADLEGNLLFSRELTLNGVRDIVLAGNNNQRLYATNGRSDIRQFNLNVDGSLPGSPPTIVYRNDGSSIVNLKIVGNDFYWVDATAGSVQYGVLENNALVDIETLFSTADGLVNPTAIAVGVATQNLYIADLENDGVTIYRGNLGGTGSLAEVYTSATTGAFNAGITDMEIDEDSEFIYWMLDTRDSNFEAVGGLYRTSTTSERDAELIFNTEAGNYFDLD